MVILKISLIISLFILTVQCFSPKETVKNKEYAIFNDQGDLMRPLDYRSWIFAGTVTTPKILDSAALFSDFQNIYIDPVSFDFWKENGYFREGTVMVKELLKATDLRKLPIGEGFVQGKSYSFSVTIKDTVKYPDVPGGWEYFHFGAQDNGDYDDHTGPVGKTLGCIACHSLSEQGYGPFSELYTPLRDAKGFGKDSPENLKNKNSLPSAKLHVL